MVAWAPVAYARCKCVGAGVHGGGSEHQRHRSGARSNEFHLVTPSWSDPSLANRGGVWEGEVGRSRWEDFDVSSPSCFPVNRDRVARPNAKAPKRPQG